MGVQFNSTQRAPVTPPTAPLATAKQAGKDGENSDSSISSSSSGKGFIATILSPFKAIASFIATIFSKIFCCCCGDKTLKGQKAALETFQKAVQAVVDLNKDANPNYKAAVAALPKVLKDAILADLKGQCDRKWANGQEKHQRYAEDMLNELCNIDHEAQPGVRPSVVIFAVEAIPIAVRNILTEIEA